MEKYGKIDARAGDPEAAAETDRSMAGVPLAFGFRVGVSAFASSVWHRFVPTQEASYFVALHPYLPG